ncbi:thioredoxin family protein [Altererythrobacter sp. GH1-8]|uniref:thioredoxin family protein n=1 Tax=Altererythrobacter sp. GH1-8 TaxID=3349333 RepID=UPI00374DA119
MRARVTCRCWLISGRDGADRACRWHQLLLQLPQNSSRACVLGKLDTEAEQELAGRYGIRSIPTIILIAKGQEIARRSGAMPASAIIAWASGAVRG